MKKQRNQALWAWVGGVHLLTSCLHLCSAVVLPLPSLALGFCFSQLSQQMPKS